jgi:hypothetical protein
MTDKSAQQKKSRWVVVDLSTVLAVLAVVFFPIVPYLVTEYLYEGPTTHEAGYYVALVFVLPPFCASILCLLVGLCVGIVRKSKGGIALNLLVVLGFVLWVVVSILSPSSYEKRVEEFNFLINSALRGDVTARSQVEKGAEEGDPLSQSGMGVLYWKRDQDRVQGYKWFYLAVSATDKGDLGHEVSYLNEIASEMTDEQIAEAQELAREWQREHSWWRRLW